ncbi:MAG TPA: flagellar assembly protein FliW [Fimbriimonadaceae bacterium]|nr:flagellar assembly protein FliW [Fimbriimonadaceae bacterium]
MTMTTLLSPRFGAIPFTEEDVVSMPDGLLGFPDFTRYLILQHRDGSPFRWLQCLDEPTLAFLIVDPSHYVSEYAPTLSDEAQASLELDAESPVLVYTIVTIPRGMPEKMTINLAGPIVINGANRKASQLVIDDPQYSVRHSVFDSARVAA